MLVVGVAAGLAHSAVVAGPRRELFVFGSGARGQLGLGNDESASLHEPRLVEALLGRRIAAVVCGGAHTLALTEDGSCWAWGDNEFGQIGADPKVEDARFRPEMILEKVSKNTWFV
jgi:alpha-tubulin suppressor-like RCC1 family protein